MNFWSDSSSEEISFFPTDDSSSFGQAEANAFVRIELRNMGFVSHEIDYILANGGYDNWTFERLY